MSQARISVDSPLAQFLEEPLEPDCRSGPWSVVQEGPKEILKAVKGLCLDGHPIVAGPPMDRLSNFKIISNFGVASPLSILSLSLRGGILVGIHRELWELKNLVITPAP